MMIKHSLIRKQLQLKIRVIAATNCRF